MQKVDIAGLIRTIPNYPKEGIMFRDITTLLRDPEGFRETIDLLIKKYKDTSFDYVAGIEARGFILGAALAYALGKGFIPIRKKGKLPGSTVTQSYDLEYGSDTIEIHSDAISKGKKILLIDDLIATGGTAMGAIALIEKVGGVIHETAFVVDLPELGGAQKIKAAGHKVFALCSFSGH
jgi:adenine phosphoribosyltransferase